MKHRGKWLEKNKLQYNLGAMFDLGSYMEDRRAQVDAALDRCLPKATERPAGLHKAMRYSIFSGGKRIRPILCLASAEAVGRASETSMVAAVALECLHTYTLIHDDLPAMDDDDLRRGKPTSHKVFGEANAILAGDSLLTLAFELLAHGGAPASESLRCCLAQELASAAGSRGVAGGQFEDLASEGQKPEAEQLRFIHAHKTGRLFRAACRMGGMTAGAGDAELAILSRYGDNIGLAFQIADDVLNATSTPEELGKASGSDASRRKMTYVALHGIDRAREEARKSAREAIAALNELMTPAEPLVALAEFIVARHA